MTERYYLAHVTQCFLFGSFTAVPKCGLSCFINIGDQISTQIDRMHCHRINPVIIVLLLFMELKKKNKIKILNEQKTKESV